jgi:hypothetical protein
MDSTEVRHYRVAVQISGVTLKDIGEIKVSVMTPTGRELTPTHEVKGSTNPDGAIIHCTFEDDPSI